MMSQKTLYIIGGVVVVVIVGLIITNMMGGFGGFRQNMDGTQTYTNGQGSVTVGSNASMPSGWPTDVPANYSGAKIVFAGNSNPQTGKQGSAVSYTVEGATVKAVADYYKNGLAVQGWNIEGTMDFGAQAVVGGSKDGRRFAVSISETDGVVTVIAGLEIK